MHVMIEGSLEVKFPTIWRDEKVVITEKSQKRKNQKKDDVVFFVDVWLQKVEK